jgi:glucose/arabinose dehydrogenase
MGRCFFAACSLIIIWSAALAVAPGTAERSIPKIYISTCAACHGTRLQGSQGPSLLTSKYIHGSEDEEVARSIRGGYPDKGMPAWGGALSDDEIQGMVHYIKEQRAENAPEHLAQLDEAQRSAIRSLVVHSELENFRAEIVAETDKPFGFAFLPDGRLLVTEERGELRVIENNHLLPTPVSGIPKGLRPEDAFKRFLLDVAVHPDYVHNGWIYLTRGEKVQAADGKWITQVSLIRGRLKGNAWVDSATLVRLPMDTDTGRIAFDDQGYVYLSTSGEAGINASSGVEPYTEEQLLKMPPQDLANPKGKILRYHDDGRIPADNPFVHTPGALTAIWSYGHRNPQGLAFDPATHELWSTEHGPRGGDELNLIRGGHNYGWPVISYGTRYDGLALTTQIEHEGMDQPVINWTPSIAVSAIAFYDGAAFPKWKHDLFIGSLREQELLRVVLKDDHEAVRELILKNIGRIRGIATGPEGDLYLALELRLQGLIVRLIPVNDAGPQ